MTRAKAMVESIEKKVLDGHRIDAGEALELYRHSDIHSLGFLADRIRFGKNPDPVVTYVIDRNINYTNICISGCKFCAFYRAPEDSGGFVLSMEELGRKIEETKALGGTQILLQGGLHPDLSLEFYEDMLHFIKGYDIHCHGFSPPEIVHFANIAGIPIREVLSRLIKAGLDSIPGGGAEILVDEVRSRIAPRKATAAEWLDVMETAHELGLRTTATMMFGHVETDVHRIEHLQVLRDLQERTGGFTAFIPWPFQPGNTSIDRMAATASSYLRMLALSRIFLDNFQNIQASWVTQGYKVAQLALFYGANDFGSTMIEENVVAAAGVSHRLSEKEIRRHIMDAGFTPRQRLMDYRLVQEQA